MAKGKRKDSTAVDRAAEAVGHALGSAASTPDEEGGDAGLPEKHAGGRPRDAHGAESGEAREESH